MSKNIEDKKKLTSSWFQDLQNQMISSFESLDTKKFQKKHGKDQVAEVEPWQL